MCLFIIKPAWQQINMIFQINKLKTSIQRGPAGFVFMNTRRVSGGKSLKFKDDQRGVTLLLAILVLSSILAITFSISTILFVEIRNSGDLIKTEPAIYGANGIAEEAIFNIKRGVCTSSCTYSTQLTNGVGFPNPPVVTSTTTPVFKDIIPPGTSFYTGKSYNFYDAVQGSSSTGGSQYGRVTVTYLPTGNTDHLVAYMCQFDPTYGVDPSGASGGTYNTTACSDPTTTINGSSESYWSLLNSNNYNMYPPSTESYSWDLDPSKQQQLILFNPTTSGGNNIFVNIETFSSDRVTPKGLPYAGQTAVEINASSGAVNRRIRVIVPNAGGTVAASTPLFLINAGGAAFGPDSSGYNWAADAYYGGGATYSVANAIANTNDDTLYQSERWDSVTLAYTFSGMTPNSTHNVTLKFAEIYFGIGGAGGGGDGSRVFNIVINGSTVEPNFDPHQQAGGSFTAIDKTYNVSADGSGQITIQLVPVVSHPKISAIKIE